MSKMSASHVRRFPAHFPLPELLESRQLLSMSVNAAGWTVITPQAGDRIIYCSNSTGNDANSGLSASAPVKTLARAESLLQNNTGDQLLLKAGDSWSGDFIFWKLSGRSATDPMVLGSYGTGARPIIFSGSEDGFETGAVSAPTVSNIAIMGISFISNSRDPAYTPVASLSQKDPVGINILTGGSNILIENCELQDYDDNINIQDFSGPISNVTIRRNVVLDAWSTNGHAEGMYADGVDGLTLYGNDFDHDGWNAQVPGASATFYNHDAYISGTSSNCVIEDNIFAEAAGYGLQDRPGGTVEGNVFVNDPVGMSFGLTNGATSTAGGVTGTVTDNVFIGGANIGSLQEGNGIQIGNIKPGAGAVVSDNIFTQSIPNAQPAIMLANGVGQSNPQQSVGINNLKIVDNVFYDWTTGIDVTSGQTPGGKGLTAFNGVTIEDNEFENLSGPSLENHQANYASQEAVVGNEYFNTNRWMVNDAYVPAIGTILSAAMPFASPTRTIASYNQSLGNPGSLSDFLTVIAAQTPLNWKEALEASAADTYVLAGFGVSTTAIAALSANSTPAPASTSTSTTSGSTKSSTSTSTSASGSTKTTTSGTGSTTTSATGSTSTTSSGSKSTTTSTSTSGSTSTTSTSTTSSSGSTSTASSGPARLAASTFAAVEYNDSSGVSQAAGYVDNINNGDWAEYTNVNFGTGAMMFTASTAALAGKGGSIQVRLDSPTGKLVGTLNTMTTGSLTSYAAQSTTVTGASGVHNLYLVFVGGSDMMNLSSFSFQ